MAMTARRSVTGSWARCRASSRTASIWENMGCPSRGLNDGQHQYRSWPRGDWTARRGPSTRMRVNWRPPHGCPRSLPALPGPRHGCPVPGSPVDSRRTRPHAAPRARADPAGASAPAHRPQPARPAGQRAGAAAAAPAGRPGFSGGFPRPGPSAAAPGAAAASRPAAGAGPARAGAGPPAGHSVARHQFPRPFPAARARRRSPARPGHGAPPVPARLSRIAGSSLPGPGAAHLRPSAALLAHRAAAAAFTQPASPTSEGRPIAGRAQGRRPGAAARHADGRRPPGPRRPLPAPGLPAGRAFRPAARAAAERGSGRAPAPDPASVRVRSARRHALGTAPRGIRTGDGPLEWPFPGLARKCPMLFGALLVVTWLILLTRYPHKALPVSLAALCGIGLLAAWVLWQEARDEDRLARLELSISYAPQQCSAQRPLLVSLRNTSTLPLRELTWHTTAYRAGDDLNLVRAETLARYHAAAPLAPDAQWRDCLPLPALRPGYRPETLQFRAERRR